MILSSKRAGVGFAVMELVLVLAITGALVLGGYWLYQRQAADSHLAKPAGEDMTAAELLESVPDVPAITRSGDLDKLSQAINELDLETSTNQANQLDSDVSQ